MKPRFDATRRFLVRIAAGSLALVASLAHAHAPATDMLEAAQKFLGALTAEQKKQATFPLTDAERENWNFVPTPRQGLPLKQMDAAQHDIALALLRTGLGQAGQTRAQAIIAMELVLKEIENGAARRDSGLYFVTIFGTPAPDKSWGWRFEGHHLAFNFTLVDGKHVFFAPSFIGANPAEVRAGPKKGLRVLGEEEDQGLALVNSLDETQRKTALFANEALKEIVTVNNKRATALSPVGIAASAMTPAQKEKLTALVKLYLSRWRGELAEQAFAEISQAGLEKITFAWAGGLDRSKQTYYRIQGPTFLIEFDNSQGNGNHIHTVLRDFKGDFGHDALAAHYAKEHAK
jgi:hypothetical protein